MLLNLLVGHFVKILSDDNTHYEKANWNATTVANVFCLEKDARPLNKFGWTSPRNLRETWPSTSHQVLRGLTSSQSCCEQYEPNPQPFVLPHPDPHYGLGVETRVESSQPELPPLNQGLGVWEGLGKLSNSKNAAPSRSILSHGHMCQNFQMKDDCHNLWLITYHNSVYTND